MDTLIQYSSYEHMMRAGEAGPRDLLVAKIKV